MCNLSWTPHSSLEKDNSLNHSCVSPNMPMTIPCMLYTEGGDSEDTEQRWCNLFV